MRSSRHRDAQLVAPYVQSVVLPNAADVIDACEDADNLWLQTLGKRILDPPLDVVCSVACQDKRRHTKHNHSQQAINSVTTNSHSQARARDSSISHFEHTHVPGWHAPPMP